MSPRISIIMAVYKRPQRTERAIRCMQNQTLQDFEAFILGDGCPTYDSVISKMNLDERFICKNWEQNQGGWGYAQLNYGIQNATAPYVTFMGNDDMISPCRLKTYVEAIEDTPCDFMYFDMLVLGKLFKTKLKFCHIGHGAMVIRTEFLRKMPPHTANHCHDFELVKQMIAGGGYTPKATHHPNSLCHSQQQFTNRLGGPGLMKTLELILAIIGAITVVLFSLGVYGYFVERDFSKHDSKFANYHHKKWEDRK